MPRRPPSTRGKLTPLVVITAAACATTTVQQAALSPVGPARADSGRSRSTMADMHFMAGMIAHHAQAVLMAGWAPSHGAGAAVQALCERIVAGQRDEIVSMQRWLRERHEPVPAPDPRGYTMPGMDHPMLMPGMLTPEQLAQLDSARGPEFERLFLKFMIQHHQGALTMVRQLLDGPGAARDGLLFQFASDVSADQAVEIDRMTRMLAALSQNPQRSPQ